MNISHERIRRTRRAKDLTGAEVAEKLGISTQYYYNIERGRRKLSAENAIKLADIFEVSLDYLIGQSAGAWIEERMKQRGITIEELANKAHVKVEYLQRIDEITPYPGDYEAMDRIAKALFISPRALQTALARQEPPAYDGPPDTRSIEEIFGNEDFEEVLREEVATYEAADKILKPMGTSVTDIVGNAIESDDPEINLFFKDFLNAPEEARESMLKVWEIIRAKEKDRKPGDKQGE